MAERSFSAQSSYRYGFNGKENDNEVKGEGNQIDYGERIYDPRLARFYSVDPMFKDYTELSAYQYASNNPIFNIDLDGLEGTGGTATKLGEEAGKAILRVATKDGVERGAKVVVMKATEKVVESPGFWKRVGISLLTIGSRAAGVVTGVLIPLDASPRFPHGDELYYIHTPEVFRLKYPNDPARSPTDNLKPNPTALPNPAPNPGGDDGGNKHKKFWVTYTKTKVMPDGTVKTYSGRSSGTYSGVAPTQLEKQAAIDRRETTHYILNEEGYQPAVLDQSSTIYASIRGREQQLIDYHGGAQSDNGISRNKIRGVSRNNYLKDIYDAAATREFGKLPNNNPVDKKGP